MGKTIFFKKIENTSTIAANKLWSPSNTQLTEDNEIARYAPYNHITIHNTSDKDIDLRLYGENQSNKGVEFVPAGAIVIFDKADDIQFYRPAIYNRNASLTIAANKIILEVRKVVD